MIRFHKKNLMQRDFIEHSVEILIKFFTEKLLKSVMPLSSNHSQIRKWEKGYEKKKFQQSN